MSCSSAEAELRALVEGICEGMDQMNSIRTGNHDRTKHIDINRFFIRETLDYAVVNTSHIPRD